MYPTRRLLRWSKSLVQLGLSVWFWLILVMVLPLSASSQVIQPAAPFASAAVGTRFTYQGQLLQNGVPANGGFDFQFTLFDAESGGNGVGNANSLNNVTATNGAFTVQLDFGAAFTGAPRWLEIAVRVAGNSAFVTLTPRQLITPAPYAIYADTAGSVAWANITGKPDGFADNIDNEGVSGAGGDITTVSAGNGLTGGGTNGDVTLSVNFAVVAPLNHTHAGQEWSTTSTPGLTVINTAPTGVTFGLFGQANAPDGSGVRGFVPSTTGITAGVSGVSNSVDGYGLYGENQATSSGGSANNSAVGVFGLSRPPGGIGVEGDATATSGASHGVLGYTASPAGYGVYGVNRFSGDGFATAVFGRSDARGGTGVEGYAAANSGVSDGLYGVTESRDGRAVVGINRASGGRAGYFEGNVQINGTLSKSAGSFQIDHPLDPENKYLYHSFVESPDMMNIYNGNVTLDANGEALVQMPAWFEALNMEFRYQLTAIGAPGPNLYIAQKIISNQFKIAGGAPGAEVSWQVTGIRHDPYAQAHRIPVEADKPAAERGTYLEPALYGQAQGRSLLARTEDPKLTVPADDAKSAKPMAEPTE